MLPSVLSGADHRHMLGSAANRDETGSGNDGALYHRLVPFLIASVGLGIFLYSKGALPTSKAFDHQRWWILLLIATGGLLGNFVLFSSSLQYLSPTASQVIGQLSTVGLMVASVVILKEKMRLNQIIGAGVLICGLLMFSTIA